MSVDYTTEKKNGYIYVTATGMTKNAEELLNYIDSVIEILDQNALEKVLLDHRDLQFDRKYVGTYDVALQCIDRLKQDRPLKVALLSREERMEFARIYETIGVNKGVTVKAFERPKIASVWLTEDI